MLHYSGNDSVNPNEDGRNAMMKSKEVYNNNNKSGKDFTKIYLVEIFLVQEYD